MEWHNWGQHEWTSLSNENNVPEQRGWISYRLKSAARPSCRCSCCGNISRYQIMIVPAAPCFQQKGQLCSCRRAAPASAEWRAATPDPEMWGSALALTHPHKQRVEAKRKVTRCRLTLSAALTHAGRWAGGGRGGWRKKGGGWETTKIWKKSLQSFQFRRLGCFYVASVLVFFYYYYYSVNRVESLNAFLFSLQITQIRVCFNGVFFYYYYLTPGKIHNLPPCNYLPIYVHYNAALYLCYSSSGIIEGPCPLCTHTSTGLSFLVQERRDLFYHFVSMPLHMVGKNLCRDPWKMASTTVITLCVSRIAF